MRLQRVIHVKITSFVGFHRCGRTFCNIPFLSFFRLFCMTLAYFYICIAMLLILLTLDGLLVMFLILSRLVKLPAKLLKCKYLKMKQCQSHPLFILHFFLFSSVIKANLILFIYLLLFLIILGNCGNIFCHNHVNSKVNFTYMCVCVCVSNKVREAVHNTIRY